MNTTSAQSLRPLFRLDPGWPFVLAGLALLVAGILIPAQRELHDLRSELRKVEGDELRMYARLQSYDRFLGDLSAGEPHLVRRLALAQLNLVPKGEDSFLLTPGMNQTVAQWIDESVPPTNVRPDPYPDTLLGRLSIGPNRLWLLGSAVFLLFVGLLFGPENGKSVVLDGKPLSTPPSDEPFARDSATVAAVPESPPAPIPAASTATLNTDHVRAFLAGATFVDPTDEDDEARCAAPSKIDAPTRQVLVMDDGETEELDVDVIDVELVADGLAVHDADAATQPSAIEIPDVDVPADPFADRVLGSDTEHIAPPTDGAD